MARVAGATKRGEASAQLGRRERRKRATRQALLDAALGLFGERGVYVTRIEDVTDRADVSKGAFYNYFDSKAALLAALVTQTADLLEREYLGNATAGATLAQRLEAVAAAHERFFRASPKRALVFHQARGLLELDDKAARVLRVAFSDYLRRVGRFVSPGQHRQSAAALDAASAVAGTIAGYRSFRRAAGLGNRPSAVARLLVAGVPGMAAG